MVNPVACWVRYKSAAISTMPLLKVKRKIEVFLSNGLATGSKCNEFRTELCKNLKDATPRLIKLLSPWNFLRVG